MKDLRVIGYGKDWQGSSVALASWDEANAIISGLRADVERLSSIKVSVERDGFNITHSDGNGDWVNRNECPQIVDAALCWVAGAARLFGETPGRDGSSEQKAHAPEKPAKAAASLPDVAALIPATGFLRLPQIIGKRPDEDDPQGIPALVPVSRATWWAWVRAGRAPAPVKLGPNTTAWRVEDIREFCRQMASGVSHV